MIESLKKSFRKIYNEEPEYYIDTGGRLEICGNHTDHNHGLCLVANCDLRIRAVVKPYDNKVSITSKGYAPFEFDINDLIERKNDTKTCLVAKGILYKAKELGYKIGGFKAYVTSEIPDGSGVSSSAAVESLFGYIVSYLFNEGKISPFEIAKIGQFSENNYFHKPSGLLDQIGTSFDSSNYIDFSNINDPIIETLPFNLPLDIFLIKSEGDHSNLTPLYARIPKSMNRVASMLDNKKYLRECENVEDKINKIDNLMVSNYEKNCAKHFFFENLNVTECKKAIQNNDLNGFLNCVRASQESSKTRLENTFVATEYIGSPQFIIDKVNEFIKSEDGAIRIHGGGFKGTVIAFIKKDKSEDFIKYLNSEFKGSWYKVNISSRAVNFEVIK